jgi:hypothetical protein
MFVHKWAFFHFRGYLCPGYMEGIEIKIQWHSKAVLMFPIIILTKTVTTSNHHNLPCLSPTKLKKIIKEDFCDVNTR